MSDFSRASLLIALLGLVPLASFADSPASALECRRHKQDNIVLSQVGERVYELRVRGSGGAPGKPISWILTDEGVVVIDTAGRTTAEVAKRLIANQTDQPIRYIVYTHHHGTQLGGASVLKGPETEIVAHRDLPLKLDLRNTMGAYFDRVSMIQFDLGGPPKRDGYLYPDITYDGSLELTLGGVTIELQHLVGEASDYTAVRLPEQGVVFVADLLANGMPMVASPMKPVRNELLWRRSLEYLRSLEPQALLLSGATPYCKPQRINEHLTAHIDFFSFLHEAVAESLNGGQTVDEAVSTIRLPEELATSPYLRERYATLEFAVRGLHHRYSGWFDQNGSNIRLLPAAARARSFVADMGGGPVVLERARELAAEEQASLALHYLDLLIDAGTLEREARVKKAEILTSLAEENTQWVERRMYKRLSIIERQRIAESG